MSVKCAFSNLRQKVDNIYGHVTIEVAAVVTIRDKGEIVDRFTEVVRPELASHDDEDCPVTRVLNRMADTFSSDGDDE